MPVPTKTFRNMKRLNVLFAISALALLGSTLWLVIADHEKPWRSYQRDARQWDVAIKEDAQRNAATAEALAKKEQLEFAVERLRESLESDTAIIDMRRRLAELEEQEAKGKLPLNIAKGKIVPAEQKVERTHFEPDSPQAAEAREELLRYQLEFDEKNQAMAAIVYEIDSIKSALDKAEERLTEQRAELTRQELALTSIKSVIESLAPSSFAARKVLEARDLPLLNWFNPSEKPRQVVATGVRSDLHFMTVETIDRCMTCHVNIDKPEYELNTLLSFLERQIALGEGQDVGRLATDPVIMLDFWMNAATQAGLGAQVEQCKIDLVAPVNALRAKAQMSAIRQDQLLDTLASMMTTHENDLPVTKRTKEDGTIEEVRLISLGEWYKPAGDLKHAVISLLENHLSADEFAKLRDVYRQAAIARLNGQRAADGLAALSDSPVLLAHPKLDLYVSGDSPHPMDTPGNAVRTLGCTVCHDGAGQETEFIYTAHTPGDVWVDAQTGATVPAFLVQEHVGHAQAPDIHQPSEPAAAQVVIAAVSTSASPSPSAAVGDDQSMFVHDDLYLPDPQDAAHPFGPSHEHGERGQYVHPSGEVRPVVKQEAFWKQKYQWQHVHFDHWERPMHAMDYVESSCNKCHTDIFDIADAAPKLFEGRKLFAQIGCANCHAVSDLQTALDVKKVGPSLVHVKQKLSSDMMGSWIWSPRGFRPTARMPHYFMLENNSSPIDIRRTRTEVLAMTYYLKNAQPNESYYAKQNLPVPQYTPAILSESLTAASEESRHRGKEIFNTIGCLACHTNLEDQSKPWLVADVAQRLGLDAPAAQQHVENMTYNERHWYAQRYIPERITLVGPELSGVGTKLMAGWPADEAFTRAKTWLVDWLRSPRHYSSYTIMPALRLDEGQASDLSDYLLSLQRPGVQRTADGKRFDVPSVDGAVAYEPGNFDPASVDGPMLKELVVALQAPQSTAQIVREEMDRNADVWTTEHQLQWLGQKMISHYGCSGCHAINGFEDAASACTTLDEWGMKDPHKLDFGYFNHAYDAQRAKPIGGWKIASEGLNPDAPRTTPADSQAVELKWEELYELERRPWLYQKLHNPRLYDRGRIALEGETDGGHIDLGRPYDKLKMPKFFLSDRQVRALTTFVTGITKAGVTPEFQAAATNDQQKRLALGRQVTTLYNCTGCHNIEGRRPAIQQYYGIYNENDEYAENLLNWAPPRLMGQGAKTQPDWLYHFLQNVNGHPNVPEPGESPLVGENKIRPWLKVRMPSFAVTPAQAERLVDYFAAHSRKLSSELHGTFQTIDAFLNGYDEQVAQGREQIARIESDIAKLQGATADPLALRRIEQLQAMKQSRLADIEEATARGKERSSTWFDERSNTAVRDAIDELADFALGSDLFPSLAKLNAEEVTDPDARALVRQTNWNGLLLKVRFLSNAWTTDYPYVQTREPAISNEQFVRGEQLFVTMGCMTGECHRVGDEQVLGEAGLLIGVPAAGQAEEGYAEDEGYGAEGGGDAGYADEGYGEAEAAPSKVVINRIAAQDVQPGGAPNLARVYKRLQSGWVENWVRVSHTIQPGTRMQEYWVPDADEAKSFAPGQIPLGRSHFRVIPYPEDQRDQFESLYGTTDARQRQLIVDFLYTVGPRAITYAPDGQRLTGAAEKIELAPLAPSVAAPAGQAEVEPQAAPPQPPAAQPEAAPQPQAEPAAVEAAVEVSRIEDFHDEASKPHAGGSRIIGQVTFDGTPPRRTPIRNLSADPFCATYHRGKPAPTNETMLVNPDGTFRNVIVHVVKGLEGKPKPQRADTYVIDQDGCMYVPHTSAVMAGQPIEIHNSDSTMHNVSYSGKNPGFNDAMVKGVVLKRVFNALEMGGSFKCNVHPWMGGNISVFDHPYFSVSDGQGRFEIAGLPPGQYTLETWHESRRIAPVQFEVTVEADTSHRVDVVVK